jgi:hypothetical protein
MLFQVRVNVLHTLKTLRYKLLAKADYMIPMRVEKDFKKTFNLIVAMQQRKRIDGVWDRPKMIGLPLN